jgi:serine protease AprX
MTSATVAGNGWMSHGLYRGMAPEAELVLVQARGSDGHIGSARIARALSWIRQHARMFEIRVVSVSLGGAPATTIDDVVDAAVQALVRDGITVVVAAGNDGDRRLVPPATAPDALTIGGLDDRNVFDAASRALWHSNYGESIRGRVKPDLVAPSMWVVAPMLPGSDVAYEARALFERRRAVDRTCETRIGELKLVTPYYQHVEGTSFAAPIVAGTVAGMLELNDALRPGRIRELLLEACTVIPGAPLERQGAGAIDAGRAAALTIADLRGPTAHGAASPQLDSSGVRFRLHDHRARSVRVLGSWNGWRAPGLRARLAEPLVWEAMLGPLESGAYAYKFLLDDVRWVADPANPSRTSDGLGGWNSTFEVNGNR